MVGTILPRDFQKRPIAQGVTVHGLRQAAHDSTSASRGTAHPDSRPRASTLRRRDPLPRRECGGRHPSARRRRAALAIERDAVECFSSPLPLTNAEPCMVLSGLDKVQFVAAPWSMLYLPEPAVRCERQAVGRAVAAGPGLSWRDVRFSRSCQAQYGAGGRGPRSTSGSSPRVELKSYTASYTCPRDMAYRSGGDVRLARM